MGTFVNDTFTDTAGTLLTAHTGELGSPWTRTTATAAITPPVVDSTGGRFRPNSASNCVLYSSAVATADGEYAELVVDNLSNSGTYAVGIRCNNLRGYYFVIGGGVARIMRLSSGTFTQLTSNAKAHVVGQHTIKIRATGTGSSVIIDAWFDDVLITTPFTDSTGNRITTLGSAGILLAGAENDSTGNHAVSLTAVQPDGGGDFTMGFSSPTAGYLFPRTTRVTGTSGTVTAGYTYSGGTPTTIEGRLVTSAGGSALSGFDWATLVASPSGGGGTMTFSAVPTGGPYYIQQRDSAAPGTVVETGPVFVGARFSIIGQSPALKAFTTGDSTLTPNAQLRITGNIGGWMVANTASMNGAIAFGNAMITALGCPVALMDYGVDGSGLVVVSNGSRWVPSSSNAYVAFKAGLDLIGGQIEGLVWAQGEGDAIQSVTQADYYTGLGTLFSNIRTDAAHADLPIVLVTLGRRLDGTLADVNSEAIKAAQAQKCLDPYVYRVDRVDLPVSGDNIHQTAAGFTAIYQRAAEAMKYAFGLTSQYRGPSITSVAVVNSATFDVNLTHHAGNDYTPTTGITGFSATDPGASNGVITVSSAVRQSATVIRLVLASAPVSNPVIRYLYGTNPTVTGAAKDNSSLTFPLEYSPSNIVLDAATMTWTEQSDTHSISTTSYSPSSSGVITVTEAEDIFSVNVYLTVTVENSWTEAPDSFNIAVAASPTASGNIGWTEQPDIFYISASVTNNSSMNWVEEGDVATISLNAIINVSTHWEEQADSMSISLSVPSVGVVLWTEANDICNILVTLTSAEHPVPAKVQVKFKRPNYKVIFKRD